MILTVYPAGMLAKPVGHQPISAGKILMSKGFLGQEQSTVLVEHKTQPGQLSSLSQSPLTVSQGGWVGIYKPAMAKSNSTGMGGSESLPQGTHRMSSQVIGAKGVPMP